MNNICLVQFIVAWHACLKPIKQVIVLMSLWMWLNGLLTLLWHFVHGDLRNVNCRHCACFEKNTGVVSVSSVGYLLFCV